MNLRDLQYLVSVAKHLHFGKAADECNVSQPALSMQINKLEDYLEIKIFERTNKKVLVTDVGKKIIERAKQALQVANEIHEIANMYKNPNIGILKLGAFPTIAPYLLPQIVPSLSDKYKEIKLFLIEEKTEVLVSKLISGELDIAILATPADENILESFPLFNDHFVYAVPKNHAQAKSKSISKANILNEQLLLLEEGHCLRDQALDYCSVKSKHNEHNFYATSLETLRQMVAAGVGTTLMPKIAIKPDDNIVYIPIEPTAPYRTISLVWRKSSPKHEFFLELAKFIQKSIN